MIIDAAKILYLTEDDIIPRKLDLSINKITYSDFKGGTFDKIVQCDIVILKKDNKIRILKSRW